MPLEWWRNLSLAILAGISSGIGAEAKAQSAIETVGYIAFLFDPDTVDGKTIAAEQKEKSLSMAVARQGHQDEFELVMTDSCKYNLEYHSGWSGVTTKYSLDFSRMNLDKTDISARQRSGPYVDATIFTLVGVRICVQAGEDKLNNLQGGQCSADYKKYVYVDQLPEWRGRFTKAVQYMSSSICKPRAF